MQVVEVGEGVLGVVAGIVEEFFDGGEGRVVDVEGCGSLKTVSYPAELDSGDGEDAGGGFEGVSCSVDQVWFDAIHESASDALDGSPEQDDDRGGDDDADDGIGEGEAEHHADCAEDDGEGGEPVEAGMDPVCDESRGADLLSDPDAIDGDDLVPGEADEASSRDKPKIVDFLRLQEPADGFPCRDDRGEGDDGNDEQAGNVLGPPEAVGVAAGGVSAAEDECDPQGDGGQGVGEVVDGVGEEGDGSADEEDEELQDRRREQDDQADLQGSDALRARLERVVDRVGGVVGVRDEQTVEESFDPCRVGMPVGFVPVPVLRAMPMPVLRRVVVVVLGGLGGVIVVGAHEVISSAVRWWWRGETLRLCSAWKMASVTSWLACSLASR